MRPPFVPTPQLGPTMLAIRRYFDDHRANGRANCRTPDRDALAVRLERCDPRAIVRRAIEGTRPHASMRDAHLHADAVAVSAVLADPRRVIQLLSTLVEYSLDLARPGGEVVVSARSSGRDVRFIVASSANGWMPDQVAPVFDQYHVDAEGDLHAELYTCRQIVEAHQGRAGVLAVLGGSTTLWFTIPTLAPATSPRRRA